MSAPECRPHGGCPTCNAEPMWCSRCENAQVQREGALCDACEVIVEAEKNEDAGIDAEHRLRKLRVAEEAIGEVIDAHPVVCRCVICNAWWSVRSTIRAISRPGFDGPGRLVEIQP